MITVTGIILNAGGAAGSAVAGQTLQFLSISTPIAGSGQVIANSRIITTVANDGTFSQQLEPGNYSVTITLLTGEQSSFTIAVPPGTGTATIDTLITTSLVYTYPGIGTTWPGTNFRIALNLGMQIYNNDTGLWHTLTVFGNPPQLALDAGSA